MVLNPLSRHKLVCKSFPEFNGPFMHGGLSARPVKTLLISWWVNAGKFSTYMTLLPYPFSVKWRKYHYIKLINEFLAIFYCTYPIENAVWMLISRIQQLLQRQRLPCDVDKWPQWEANECMRSAPRNPQDALSGCVPAREIRVYSLRKNRTISQSPVNIISRCELFV